MSKKKCCKSKKPCKDCPRNKKKKISAAGLGISHAADKLSASDHGRQWGVIRISIEHGDHP